jgi:serine/threonine protein kinase
MAERWLRIKEVFQAAIDRPVEERAAFLGEACGDDGELRREVESLLSAHRGASRFLSEPVLSPPAAPSFEGRLIGHYRVLAEIGRGGMGIVYRAVRDDDVFRKTVALKLVHGGAGREYLRRLGQERRILAQLQHPNIATILDGGTTDEGQPYFVMEHIEGQPIDAYCDRHGLDTRQRLEMFRTVCAAVQYAHQNLVLHRDLKPANILVTADGRPNLLDFGIAKLLAAGREPDETPTVTLGPALTPEYASPEQVRGQPVTTASDVYSLGVLLYELLTGQRPFAVRNDSLEEMVRAVCETEPPAPSAARRRLGSATTRSGVSPGELLGDLDTIVLKALRKEPARRYLSAHELSEDIRRHLQGLPVLARPDTITYRLTKFVGRHRVGVAAAAVVLVSLLGGFGTAVWQWRLAERRFGDVRRLANSLMFEIHDAIQSLPGSTPARRLLVQKALDYLNRLAAEASRDPELLGELAAAYERIGDIQGNPMLENLGDLRGALESYRKAVAIHQALPDDPKRRRALAGLQRRIGNVLEAEPDTAGALKSYQAALALQEGLLSTTPADESLLRAAAASCQFLGDCLLKTCDLARGLEIYRKEMSFAERSAALASSSRLSAHRRATGKRKVGDGLLTLGRLPAALESFREGLALVEPLAESVPNDSHLAREAIAAYQRIANVLDEMNRPLEALPFRSRAIASMETLRDADRTNVLFRAELAELQADLGRSLLLAGRAKEAVKAETKALGIIEYDTHGEYQDARIRELVSLTHASLGDALTSQGRQQEARASYEKALSLCQERDADPSNVEVRQRRADILNRLGALFLKLGQGTKADECHAQAVELLESASVACQAVPKVALTLVRAYSGRGAALTLLGGQQGPRPERLDAWRQARRSYERSLAGLRRLEQDGVLYGSNADQLGKTARALADVERALQTLGVTGPWGPP